MVGRRGAERYQSFRFLLLAGTLGIVVSLSCLMLVLSLAQSTVQMGRLTAAELAQVAKRTEDRVRQLLRAAEMTAESAARQMADGLPAAGEIVPFFAGLVAAFEQRPELTYLGCAVEETGDYALMERRPDGSIWLRLYLGDPYAPRIIEDYAWSGTRFVRQPDPTPEYYDPRIRPFFARARKAGKPVWTSIYRFVRREATDSAFGITYALPLYDAAGKLVAVWDADFDLLSLAEFTRTLQEETGALAAVVAEIEQVRTVISDRDAVNRVGDRMPGDWAVQALAGGVLEAEGPLAFAASGNSRGLLAVARPLGDPGMPDWTILAAVPRARVEAPIQRQRWLYVGVAGVVALLGGAGAVWTAGRLSRPLVELREAVNLLRHDADPKPIRHTGRIVEIASLARAFERMAATVRARQRETSESRARLQAHLDHTPLGVLQWDEHRRITYCNAAAATIRGRDVHAIVGTTVDDLLEADEVDDCVEGLRGLADGAGSVQLFHRVKREGGRSAECEWYVTADVSRRASGRPTGATAMLLDVSERLGIEEAYRAAETRFHVTFQRAPVPMLITRLSDSRIIDMNTSGEREFGFPRERVVGRTTLQLGIWADATERGAVVGGLDGGGDGRAQAVRLKTASGETRTVLVSASRLTLAGEACVLWAAVDVTERERMAASLHASQALRSAAFEAAHSPMITLAEGGRILDFNLAAEARFGCPRDTALGRDIVDTLAAPGEGSSLAAFVARLFAEPAGGGRLLHELRLHLRDGARLEFEVSAARSTVDGAVLWTVAFRDVTAAREAARQIREANVELERRVAERTADLSRANEKLRELDRLKSEFLATMSHELRTPLNSILGFTELVRSGRSGPVVPEQERQLGLVHRSARHLLDLINDLLDLSRIEAGRLDLVREVVDPVEVVRAVVAVMEPTAAAKGLGLVLETPDSRVSCIESDRKRVFQIVLNLVANAVKFTGSGGIRIVVASADAGAVSIAVHDTGIGISEEQLPLLFEAFRRLEGSARRVVEGTGLGLYLVAKLLALLGGAIDVRSVRGEGSVFTVVVPASMPHDPLRAFARGGTP
jgi:PAS domain S-box-containing protein